MLAGLSVVHGLIPPHPAALLAVQAYNADIGKTIAYALLVGVPTAIVAGLCMRSGSTNMSNCLNITLWLSSLLMQTATEHANYQALVSRSSPLCCLWP